MYVEDRANTHTKKGTLSACLTVNYMLNQSNMKNIAYGLQNPTYDDYEIYKENEYYSLDNHHKLMWIFINKLDIKDKNYNGLNYTKISYKFCQKLDILKK